MSTWRKDPFVKGRSYRVRKAFASVNDAFAEGEVLTYKESLYIRYDSSSEFAFADGTGRERFWEIGDHEPMDGWMEFFEEVEGKV